MPESMKADEESLSDTTVFYLSAKAIAQLQHDDARLFDYGVHERTISFRLGMYLQPLFPDWTVDCEYNRLGRGTKRFPDDPPRKWMAPDVVIHQRDETMNLACFEMKPTRDSHIDDDQRKLAGLTENGQGFEYRLGIQLVFDAPNPSLAFAVVFKRGALDVAATESFMAILSEYGLLAPQRRS